jgi:hypothetical protein
LRVLTNTALTRWLWPVAFALLLVWSVVIQHGGYFHYEGQFFLSNYLTPRGFADTIFSVHRNDWDCFMARELAYVFDWFDAQAVVVGARLGMPHLYSFTTYVALFLIAVTMWHFLSRHAAPIGATTAGLLVALFLTSPVASLSGYYYRSSKVLLSLLLLLAVREIFGRDRTRTRFAWRLFAIALALTLVDRGGIFLAFVLGVLLAIVALVRRDRRLWPHLAALAAAGAANVIYNQYVGRWLVSRVDGEWPSLFGQRVRVLDLLRERWHYTSAIKLIRDQIDFVFGNWHPAMGFVIGGLIALGYWLRASPTDESLGRRSFIASRLPFVLFVVGAGMVGLLCMVMLYKLNSVVWPESRRVYYWLPVATIIPIAAAFALATLVDRFPRAATPTRLVLAAMVITNLFALPGHQAIIRSREQQPQVAESARVRECFVGTDAIGTYSLSRPAAYACASVRARAFGRPISADTPPGTPLPELYCRPRPTVPARPSG